MKKTVSFLLALLLTVSAVAGMTPAAFAEEGSAYIEITKPPYGEEVNEGDDASFIARAEGYQGLIWLFDKPLAQAQVFGKLLPADKYYLVGQVLATGIAFFWNFFARKYLLYNKKN